MTESKAREFILKKKEKQTIDADYNAIEAHPESECDPKDIEAEKILKYIRVIEKSFADQLQVEIKAKDELLRECEELIKKFDPDDCFTFDNDSDELRDEVVALIQKLREGKK